MEPTRALVLVALVLGSSTAAAQSASPPPPVLTPSEMEAFLLNGRIVTLQRAGKGVTGSDRATLRQGDLVHDVHVQYIDEARQLFEAGRASEVNFRDSFRYNIAGYRLAQLLGLRMVPMAACERRPCAGVDRHCPSEHSAAEAQEAAR